MNTQKWAEKVLILGVKLLANFFGEFINGFLYMRFWIMQALSFKKCPPSFYMFSTVINRLMRISSYLWSTELQR
jgi:hypothetical protein